MSEPITEPKNNRTYEKLREQLDLAGLNWVAVDASIDPAPPIPCTARERAQKTIILLHQTFVLEADHMMSDTHIGELYVFTILDQNQKVLEISLSINNSRHGVTVGTNVGKVPRSRLPGMPLYHQVLDYIQTLSNQRNQVMTHQVKRSAGETRLGRQVLGVDDWNIKFKPTLEARGYKEVKDFVWEKSYRPTSQPLP